MDPEGSSRKAHPRRESSVAAEEPAAPLRPATDGPAPAPPDASASADVAAAAADDGLKAAAL